MSGSSRFSELTSVQAGEIERRLHALGIAEEPSARNSRQNLSGSWPKWKNSAFKPWLLRRIAKRAGQPCIHAAASRTRAFVILLYLPQ
jgi:hypothetical protein